MSYFSKSRHHTRQDQMVRQVDITPAYCLLSIVPYSFSFFIIQIKRNQLKLVSNKNWKVFLLHIHWFNETK